MQDFRKLKVWQKAHTLTVDLHVATRRFPREELFGITSQIRRAASSIGANLAEGCGRGGDADFARFVQIALGSASELEYHLLLAHDLGFLDRRSYSGFSERTVEVKRMLTALASTLRVTTKRTRKAPQADR